MNGGFTNYDAYEIIDNDRNILKAKVKSFNNLVRYNIKNISPSAIILKGVNENVIREIVDKCLLLDNKYVQIRFRSEGQLGKYVNSTSYSTQDFIDRVFPDQLGHINDLYGNVLFDGNGPRCYKCCFDFKISDNVFIRQLEFGSKGAMKCYKRGYVDFERKKIYPFFEYQNLKTKYIEEVL